MLHSQVQINLLIAVTCSEITDTCSKHCYASFSTSNTTLTNCHSSMNLMYQASIKFMPYSKV